MTVRLFDIQRFSIHDGPGIRTTVFLNGCPLHCPWCANPESQRGRTELLYVARSCTHCGRCAAACPHEAVRFTPEEGPCIEREKCRRCGACVSACLSGALRLSGRTATVAQVMEPVRKDAHYYEATGGGVTFSGGEPLLQPEALAALLRGARAEGFSTTVETTGNVSAAAFAQVLGQVDVYLYDLKHCDRRILKQMTGGDLEQILKNLETALADSRVLVRVPVIPGFNHDAQTLGGIFSLAAERGAREADLLPYHVLGRSKYAQLGLPYTVETDRALDKKDLLPYVELGERQGLHVTISGKEAAQI